MFGWFHTLTEAQAILLSGLLTLCAAAVAVVLGNLLFSGRVTDLRAAFEQSQQALRDHLLRLDTTITAIEAKTQELDSVLAAMSEGLAKQQGQLHHTLPQGDAFHAAWARIRNRMDEAANDPRLSGHARARYARLTRRDYPALAAALAADGALPLSDPTLEAAALWQAQGKGQPASPADTARMTALAALIAP